MRKTDEKQPEKQSILNNREPYLDLNLDKVIATLKQNASWYQHAGMTHISSLLE